MNGIAAVQEAKTQKVGAAAVALPAPKDNTFLINMALGGFSILFMMACWIFIDRGVSVYNISQIAFAAAFIANHPHFASSYMLLYSDFRKNIFKNIKYFWAAVIVPAVLFSYLLYCLMAERSDLLGHSVNAMFFLVGWHYVKQIFGVVVVTSALKRYFYTKNERNIILLNLFSIWGISFFNSQTYIGNFDFYGIKYASFGFDPIWLKASYVVFAFSLVTLVGLHVKKYIQEGTLPISSAVIAMVSLYAWYLPAFSHPHFAYLIPFFHSLQYLVFVWFFKKNQVKANLPANDQVVQRREWIRQFGGYIVVSLILGAMFFEFIPKNLDKVYKFSEAGLGGNPILVVFLLFINIHHYFIDNVIWKSANPEVKKHLFMHEQ
ncbi:MAG: hypothetical protein K0R29_981 [Pseudobdellovibrio sp.]|jgi:hypothetical protein|nr:hypothetical protein [Pseudobdellovibrio sp.]